MTEVDDAGERRDESVHDGNESVDSSVLERADWNELLGVSLTARCANSGTTTFGEGREVALLVLGVAAAAGDRDLVCCKCGDVAMGYSSPLLRFTYSCHLGLLRSGGGGAAADTVVVAMQGSGLLGISLPRPSFELRPEESVEVLAVEVMIRGSGRRCLLSLRSLFLGLGSGSSCAGIVLCLGG